MKSVTPQQKNWLLRMQRTLDQLHNQWYGHDGTDYIKGGINKELLAETDRKIREACRRLNIEVVAAFDPDGWDGERYEPLMTLGEALGKILNRYNVQFDWKHEIVEEKNGKNDSVLF